MANREREPEHREYKRDPIVLYTCTTTGERKETRLVIGEQWRRKGTKEVASSALQ
jgi:hypothetical protein